MIPDRGRQAIWTALGVSAGVATGLWLWRRQGEREVPHLSTPSGWSRPRGSGAEVAEALRRDRTLGRRAVEVDSIAEGVIELTGEVSTHEEARRAVSIAQGTRGVHTVVNRLTLEDEEARRAETQKRRENGAPELQERQHYGMGVGMGTRRQSPDTDPDRPSDKQKILERELDVANVEDAPEAPPEDGRGPISGGEAVESSRVEPGDERAIEDAGLDPSPRPTSIPTESEDTDEDGRQQN